MPQIKVAQGKASDLYEASVASHVNQISAAATPYYKRARDNAAEIHTKYLLPAYTSSQPYFWKSYDTSYSVVAGTALPLASYAWNSAVIFVDGTLWPTMKGLYGANVEPQLVRIGERLARYREGRKLKAAMDEVESSLSASPKTTPSPTDSPAQGLTAFTQAASSEAASTTASTSEQQIASARDQIAKDLREWQEKFASAADKGSEDLAERVKEIMDGLLNSEVKGEGEGLVVALEKTAENELSSLKTKINSIASALSDEAKSSDEENAESELLGAVRTSGLAIKGRATALRQWFNTFDETLFNRASTAAETTLEVLDNIRDLGLQEIGMRWAWMDGVTYKDWAKYHALKKQFEEWRNEVRDVAMEHEALKHAKATANDVVSSGMGIAEDSAKELARLREVGKWKIAARDSTDNFETRVLPAAAVRATQSVADAVENVSEAIAGTSQGSLESVVSGATASADSAASQVSSRVLGSDSNVYEQATAAASDAVSSAGSSIYSAASSVVQPESSDAMSTASEAVEDVASAASESAKSYATQASRKVWGGAMAQKVSAREPILDDIIDDNEDTTYSAKLQNFISEAGDRYADITKAVSEAMIKPAATQGTTQGTVESMQSVASDRYSSALAAASSAMYGTTQGTGESVASIATEQYSAAVAA